MIEDEDFDPKAVARPAAETTFRAVGTYREFASAIRGRASRQGVDEQAAHYRAIYKKIEAEATTRQRADRNRRDGPTVRYVLVMGLWGGAIVAGVAVLIGLGMLLVRWMSP